MSVQRKLRKINVTENKSRQEMIMVASLIAIKNLLIEKGVFNEEELQKSISNILNQNCKNKSVQPETSNPANAGDNVDG